MPATHLPAFVQACKVLTYGVINFDGSKLQKRKMSAHKEIIQKQIHQDWANREYIEVITASIKRVTDFLNSFDMSCRSRLAVLNEKLTTLERRIDYLEACVTQGETLT